MNAPTKSSPWLVGALTGLSLGLVVLLGILLMQRGTILHSSRPDGSNSTVVNPRPDRDVEADLHEDRANAIVQAARKVSPVVVSINTLRAESPPADAFELFDYLMRGPRRSIGLGSGILVDSSGYVLTAYHVVANSERLNVTLNTGQTFAARVIGGSPEFDLAVVRIQGEVSGLPVAQLGDSDELQNGEWAIAIGSPFGYLITDSNPTVTVGVISAVHRDVRLGTQERTQERTMYDMIQTDAAINPGNSGGPLVNSSGEVIGINTSVITDGSGTSLGLGFAVPINRARWVMDELRQYGRIRPHTMGINGFLLTAEKRQQMNLGAEVPDGWAIESIAEGSEGERVGLVPGDIITHTDGVPLFDAQDHARVFYEARVGSTLRLTIWRVGEIFDVDVTLTEKTDP